jgi:PDDEXK-like domain of unknown function (DUF3799)
MTSRSESVPPPAALPPVRFSRLKKMDDSPAHYLHGYGPETDPMAKGTALHAFMLGGSERVVVYEGGPRNPRGKKWLAFQEEHEGKHIIIPSQLAIVDGMRRSIEAHPRAMELLDDGIQETRITWDINGRACAGTPDVVLPKNRRKRLVELKTCVTSNPRRFKWHALKQGWFAQVAWYADGLERSLDYAHGPVDEVYIVAVESKPPHPVTVFRVRQSMLQRGREQYRIWFDTLLACEAADDFPAYATGDVDIEDDDDSGLDWGTAA